MHTLTHEASYRRLMTKGIHASITEVVTYVLIGTYEHKKKKNLPHLNTLC